MTKAERWIGVLGVVSTLAAAIAGAWIGGSLATRGARDLQAQQARLTEARNLAAARASARLLIAELSRADAAVTLAATDACWWKQDYRVHLSATDRTQLAAKLPAADWTALANMLNLQDRVAVERVGGFQWSPSASSPDMDVVIETFAGMKKLIPQLSGFARIKAPRIPEEPKLARDYRSSGSAPGDAVRNRDCPDAAG